MEKRDGVHPKREALASAPGLCLCQEASSSQGVGTVVGLLVNKDK